MVFTAWKKSHAPFFLILMHPVTKGRFTVVRSSQTFCISHAPLQIVPCNFYFFLIRNFAFRHKFLPLWKQCFISLSLIEGAYQKTMVSVLTRAKKCAKISIVFEKDAGVAQSVEQLIRNQQVMCSSHTTSSKKHRKLRFSMLFCCKNAENGVGQNAGQLLTHTVTHMPKCADRFKEYRRGTGHLTLRLCRISENFRKLKKYRAF